MTRIDQAVTLFLVALGGLLGTLAQSVPPGEAQQSVVALAGALIGALGGTGAIAYAGRKLFDQWVRRQDAQLLIQQRREEEAKRPFVPRKHESLQHAESQGVQEKSVRIYNALAEGVSETLRETFLTFAQFAELHRDIVAQFGRFPHRNRYLGRNNTPEEEAYLAADGPSFGQ